MQMKRVNEGSDAQLTLRFLDADEELAVPQSVEYRIDCKESRTQIRDWTELAPAPEITINLTADDNATYLPAKGVETHEVTVRAGYGSGEFLTGHYFYEIENLRFLDS